MHMVCPHCTGKMKAERHAGVELDRCAECGALWFDKGELKRVLRRVTYRTGFRPERDSKPLRATHPAPGCPKCDAESLEDGLMWSLPATRCSRCSGFLFPPESLQSLSDKGSPSTGGAVEDTVTFGPLLAALSAIVRAIERRLPQ